MSATHLTGLSGNNPLAFMAALGIQVLFNEHNDQPRLWCSDGVTPHAVINPEFRFEEIMNRARDVFPQWLKSPAMNPGTGTKADNTAKFNPSDRREYLKRTRPDAPGNRLASALVAEGSLDRSGKSAKPSDLYFAAGQLKFLKNARDIVSSVESSQIHEALAGPWSYASKLSSLGWDTTDDRIYALGATNPSTDKKLTNPGVEALAILGLSRHPVFAGVDRTLTLGCSGAWRRGGTYTWPIWTRPAGPKAVKSILAHATADGDEVSKRSRWYKAWGISLVMCSTIRRSDQGGYGTFGPPRVIWSR